MRLRALARTVENRNTKKTRLMYFSFQNSRLPEHMELVPQRASYLLHLDC